jgi:cell division protein FtsX
MRTDELRREIQQLADAIEPFEPDALAVHRTVRRRRSVWSAVAAAAAVIVVSVTVSAAWRGGNEPAVSSSQKEYAPSALHRVDLIVVPGSVAAQRELEQSPLVARYSPIPRSALPPGFGAAAERINAAACALQRHNGFAVESATPNRDITADLQHDLGRDAKVYDISQGHADDVEVFMKLTATEAQIEAVGRAIDGAPHIRTVRFMNQQDAYAEFREDFKDQPALLNATMPNDLPVSFRITVEADATPQVVGSPFEHLPGVENVVTSPGWWNVLNLGRLLDRQVIDADAELFMKTNATAAQTRAVADLLSQDRDVASETFIDHNNALREFRQLFHDQPALLKNTTAQQLPESFRVKLRNTTFEQWTSPHDFGPGVDTVIKNQARAAVACQPA